jgi:cell division transport system permease protein
MPRIDNYFRETASGLRRNGIVAFAAMSTAFIALFLLGLALLIAREVGLVIEAQTGNVEVGVYLTDPVKQDTVPRLTEKLGALDGVASVEYWNHQKTCEVFNTLFRDDPSIRENVDCEKVIPTSMRVHLADANAGFDQVTSALDCSRAEGQLTCSEPGVLNVADFREQLKRLVSITRALSVGVLSIAIIMLGSAIALVANTLRMGMFARRKEIGIMRLVGATKWRIRVPFLIEGLVETLIGAGAAIVALFFVQVVFFDQLRGQFRAIPLIQNSDVLSTTPWIVLAAVVVAIVAGTIGMRRFLDV